MGFEERLALLIDANGAGAIRELHKVGAAAQGEFAKAETSREKWSSGLLKGGAVAVGVAAVIGKGLLGTVHAYAGYEDAQLQLQNTEQRMPQLAGASTAAFEKLAQRISDTTKVNRDQVISSESMLGQFGLTQAEILTLTPLIVDLSTKMGIDMTTATKAVGKAVEGSGGSLARYGIKLDSTKLKADGFGTVVQGLSTKVGGFATEQGKTFEGRLSIIHNQLHDLAEGVGKGATEQLSSMLGVVSGLTTGMGHLNTGTQETIGRVATIGVTALGAAGALAVGAGAALKLKNALTEVNAVTGATELTTAASAGAYAAVAVGVLALGKTLYDMAAISTKASIDVAANADSFAQSIFGQVATANQAKAAIEGLDTAVSKWGHTQGAVAEQTGASIINNLGISYRKVTDVVEQGTPAINKFVESLHLSDVNAGTLRGGLEDLSTSLQYSAKSTFEQLKASGALIPALANTAVKLSTTSDGTTNWVEALKRAASGSQSLAKASGDVTLAMDAQREATQALLDKTLTLDDAHRSVASSIRGVTSSLLDVTDRTKDYNDAVAKYGPKSEEATRAALALQDAQDGVGKSVDDAKRAIEDLATKESGASSAADAVKNHTDGYVTALGKVRDSLAPGSALRVWLDGYIAQLHNVPTQVDTHVTITSTGVAYSGGGGHAHFAGGGMPPVGEPVDVGEHGKETVEFQDPVRIIPHGQARPASGGAEEHFHLHVTPGFGSNAKQFMRDLADELVRDARNGGPVTIALRKLKSVA